MKAQFFVGHVFNTEQIDDFRWALREGLKLTVGVELWFSDEHPGAGFLLEKIKAGIDNASACFFDISIDSKPNVFIELGYALGQGKTCFILCRRGSNVPADLQGLERIEYSSYNELMKWLQANLGKMLHAHFSSRRINKDIVLLLKRLAAQGEIQKKDLLEGAKARGIDESDVLESVDGLVSFGVLTESTDGTISVSAQDFFDKLLPLASN